MSVQSNDPLVVQPIIIKKKVIHAGHHGGAWKVAYADFVTAMMSLFIVLWLMNSSEQVKKAIAGYFRDPSGHSNKNGTGESGLAIDQNVGIGKDDMTKLKEKLAEAIRQSPDVAKLKNQVVMTVTGEGLRIELLEKANSTFFESGNAGPTPSGEEMLELIASQLGKLPNRLSIEGHTDAKPYVSKTGYSNWELSTDRADAARKILQQNGVRSNQVADVRGYADQRLRDPKDPFSPSNRRVSIVVKYLIPDDAPRIAGAPVTSSQPAKPAPAGPPVAMRK
ncbi:MAG TPA: flagellar motor protein MotB [Bryobacteraceae bacterium]|nr:flagellar motor protein MotB [Bryobacteraceae bacterium]